MKKLLKKILRVEQYRKNKIIKGVQIKLNDGYQGKRLFILNVPEHGNLGDQAIYISEQKWCEDYLKNYKVYPITHNETTCAKDIIKNKMTNGDIIALHGGGYIGSIWPKEHQVFIEVLKYFKNEKIVVFPQTVFISNADSQLTREMKEVIEDCKDITIFTRDKKSYDIMTSHIMSEDDCLYVPDIVTYMKLPLREFDRDGILMCLRSDKEKVDTPHIQEIERYAEINGIRVDYTDTVIPKKVHEDQCVNEVTAKLEEFKKYQLVVTDRLHGMIFATVSSTPCIAFDNISKKVSGVYDDWIRPLDYIRCMEDNFHMKEVEQLLSKKDSEYSNKYLVNYYEIMKEKFLENK